MCFIQVFKCNHCIKLFIHFFFLNTGRDISIPQSQKKPCCFLLRHSVFFRVTYLSENIIFSLPGKGFDSFANGTDTSCLGNISGQFLRRAGRTPSLLLLTLLPFLLTQPLLFTSAALLLLLPGERSHHTILSLISSQVTPCPSSYHPVYFVSLCRYLFILFR